jgi:hypothetical protein
MSILKIKFSHDYPKLWDQTTAKLVYVGQIDGKNLSKPLIEYDTKQSGGGYYPLPKAPLIQLVFLGNFGVPFCTLRLYTKEKWDYYTSCKDKEFKIVIGEEVAIEA